MSRIRLIVAWLLMAALPLQGLAAASMLFCDQAAHSATSERAAAHGGSSHGHQQAVSAAGADAVSHDHAAHVHHGDSQQAGSADAASQPSTAVQDHGSATDGHACPICASCCNLMALAESFTLSFGAGLPAAQLLPGPSRVITRESPAPDKPPRA